MKSGPVFHLSQLNAVRLLTILIMGMGYASTMPRGPGNMEWGHIWGHDPSWFAIQIMFFLSGLMAMRSLSEGRRGWTFLKSRIRRVIPLLGLYTAAVILIIYPALCSPEARSISAAPKLAKYFFETVFLIKPSQPLPGLMDDAKYMCLAQGAIWTLRWGAVLYIGTAIFGSIRILRNKHVLLAAAVLSILLYGVTQNIAVKASVTSLEPFLAPLRLGYIYVCGMAAYAWRHHLPKHNILQSAILASLATLATVNFLFLPWTPAIEILATALFCYLATLGLQKSAAILKDWANLVLATFLGVWPLAQIFTLAFPNMSVGMVIISTLTVSLALAYTLLMSWNAIRQSLLSRKPAIQAP